MQTHAAFSNRSAVSTYSNQIAFRAELPLGRNDQPIPSPLLRRRLEPGQYLYRAGQPFQSLFYVHAGALKTCSLTADGREQITGFPMRGDFVGLESIGADAYACDAVALDGGETWELPYPACLRQDELRRQLTAALARQLRRHQCWMTVVGTLAAEQRIAAFLLDLAACYEAQGYSARHFVLRMSRVEIASYLMLTHETVSRALSHLAAIGCLRILRRDVQLLDSELLQRAAQPAAATPGAMLQSKPDRSIAPRTATASSSSRYGLRNNGEVMGTAAPA
jgi:CRP/FNR family transcriptional regulator